jgi:hypothetical protein
MYPGPEGSSLNHKRAYCSDGVKQVSKVDEVPPWPQPHGVFTAGKTFHPQAFYVTLQDTYERYCMPSAEPAPTPTMETVAFVRLLASRIRTFNDNVIGFRLFPTTSLTRKCRAVTFSAPRTTAESGCASHTSSLRALPEVPHFCIVFTYSYCLFFSSSPFFCAVLFLPVRVPVPSSCPVVPSSFKFRRYYSTF